MVLIVDSSLINTQASPSATGSVSTNSGFFQVVLTNPIQPVLITIASGTTNPTIDLGAFVFSGAGILPQITIDSEDVNHTSVAISTGTTVTSADPSWNGVIAAPTVTTVTLPVV